MKASLWRGRLGSPMHPRALEFLSSFAEDSELVDIDIDVGEAHAIALARGGALRPADLKRVLRAYERARSRARRMIGRGGGTGEFHDIHPLVEKIVAAGAGEDAGGRVHLGKSRNDQVAADICIFSRRRALDVASAAVALAEELVAAAARFKGDLFPAYTHGRPAQSTTAGHFFLAHADALGRDVERILAARRRMCLSPLGAAAVAGTSVRVDRRYTARLLGFSGLWPNSLDATSARDHVVELVSSLAILQATLSRLAADLAFLCGDEHGILSYPDSMADTSSAMPQKKNPDPLELVRGRAAALNGLLAGALGIVHGLPSGYSRDLQEMKGMLWKGLAIARDSATVVALVVRDMRIRPGAAARVLQRGYAAALDLAEILCLEKNVPFRRAHFAVGHLVRSLAEGGRMLSQAGAAEASRMLSAAAGRPVSFTSSEWTDAVSLTRGAVRRRAGGPGDTAALLAAGRRRTRKLARELRSLAAAEARAGAALRSEVGRRVRAAAGRRESRRRRI